MRIHLPGPLRWLYPGMGVKRWALLSLFSMSLVAFSILEIVGKERIREIYRLLPATVWARYVLVTLILLVGIAGFTAGVSCLVRSVARGVAPQRKEKPSEIIYRTRILERGPRIVALGGGTGLSTLLRGLKEETSNITAVVAVMDDGGSSGRLRDELDVLPPGDIRNCIIALAEDEARMSRFFQHRFHGPTELEGHSLGNLFLVGAEQVTGGFDLAVEEMSHILDVRGHVLPATLTKTHLVAKMKDGEYVEGETQISSDPRRIERISLSSPNVRAYDRALQAIGSAELLILGPGSLFTSLIPNLLVEGIAREIENAKAEKILVANLMTQPGETDGFTLCDHLSALNEYVDISRFDKVLVNDTLPDSQLLAGYREEAAEPVKNDLEDDNEFGLDVVRADLIGTIELEGKPTVKHDPIKLARLIVNHR